MLLKGELLTAGEPPLEAPCVVVPGIAYALSGHQAEKFGQLVGRCRLTPLRLRTDPAWFQHLNLKYDGLLSNFALNCNMRHYSKDDHNSNGNLVKYSAGGPCSCPLARALVHCSSKLKHFL